jgi:hypothetical protein
MTTQSLRDRRAAWLFAGAGLSIATALSSSSARADDAIAQCIAQNDQAVNLRRAGKLLEARKVRAQCASPACGPDISDNCQKEAAVLGELIPTIVFATKDGSLRDLPNVRLTVDGVALPGTLAGIPISLDPGDHEFRFESAGETPVVKHFVLLQGEHERRETIVIGNPPPQPAPPVAPQPTVQPQVVQLQWQPPPGYHPAMDSTGNTQRLFGTLLLAVGIPVTVIGTLAYGGIAMGKWQSAKNDCTTKTNCGTGSTAQNERSDALNAATDSTIFGIGVGVALVGGVLLRATAPANRPLQPPREALRLEPAVGPKGAGAFLTGVFQ